MLNHQETTIAKKALRVNLDKSAYGTFAEIGAGQEVARWFFRVGGASGTIVAAMLYRSLTWAALMKALTGTAL